MTDTNVLGPDSRMGQGWRLRCNPAGVLRKWFERLASRHVPLGYEDQTGFHYGTELGANESAASCVLDVERRKALPGGGAF